MGHQFYDVKRYATGGGCRPKGIEPVGDEPIIPNIGPAEAMRYQQQSERAAALWREMQSQRAAIEAWHKTAEMFASAPPPIAVTIRAVGAAEVEIFPDAKRDDRFCATVRVLPDLAEYPKSDHGHKLRSHNDRMGGFIVFLDAPSLAIVTNLGQGRDRFDVEKLAVRITSLAPNGKSGRGGIVTFKA